MVEDRASEQRGYVFGDPHRTSKSVRAEKLDVALEIFCSTADEPEQYVGRLTRPGDIDNPIGYNSAGVKYAVKPTLPAAANLPDDEVIQVWHWNPEIPHWNMNDPGDYELVFELPLEDIWRYDKWGNVEHPALPPADKIDVSDSALALDWLKDKSLRDMNRSEIVAARKAVLAAKKSLEGKTDALNNALLAMRSELQARSDQLFFLMLYLGREVEFTCVQRGAKADDAEKVSIRQRVLYMAEEVGISKDSACFDFRRIGDFDDWVKSPANLKLIAPEPKCIVALKPRRGDARYTDDSWLDFFLNLENRKTYFLLRNGETIFRVFADVNVGEKLFPEPEEFDNLYKSELSSRTSIRSLDVRYESWESYRREMDERLSKREKWYAKGFTEADFESPLEALSEEEWTKKHAEALKRAEDLAENPERYLEPVELQWAQESSYKRYMADLKNFFYGMAFVQGVFDNTDIFGRLGGRINLFTGKGRELVNIVYDASESRLLVDKETPDVEQWLREEALRVKEGDLVVIKDLSTPYRLAVGEVCKVHAPSQVIAQTLMHSWLKGAKARRMKHFLWNSEEDFTFFPFNLPPAKVQFYLERRQDREKYWDNVLGLLLKVKLMLEEKVAPQLAEVRIGDRVRYWKLERPAERDRHPTAESRRPPW